jgi:hypothetical protein
MNINESVETPQGTYKFAGELTGEELQYVVKLGLSVLMYHKALPVVKNDMNLSLDGVNSTQ